MSNSMKYIKLLGYGVMVLIVIDFLGAMAWAVSGQVPPDDFHAGIITQSIVRAL